MYPMDSISLVIYKHTPHCGRGLHGQDHITVEFTSNL